ncbi:DUF1643 domain-containing protein [Sporanaerobium hydrogeniformans]|uniref:DUF1643 domain-containing protein n=1 Tax=Sporanaerobium hydrogeniformans TaxID=3072179 RepID=UPI0015D4997D|nr:DUF1643 domain-containing protein [Sporanaerobium hydrogeniformans]
MIEENNTMVTRAVFSEDKSHRYLLSKEWDASLANAVVIMLQAGKSNALIQDVTTCNIINCVSQLDEDYGSVNIVNLFSRLDLELDTDIDIDDFTDEENDRQIKEVAEGAELIILAYGKAQETSLCVKQRVREVISLLEKYKDKMYLIGDSKGRKGFSAMYPKVRNKWILYKAYEEEQKKESDKVAENIETPQTEQQTIEDQKSNNETKTKKNNRKS